MHFTIKTHTKDMIIPHWVVCIILIKTCTKDTRGVELLSSRYSRRFLNLLLTMFTRDLHERGELVFDDNKILDELTGRNIIDKNKPNPRHPV